MREDRLFDALVIEENYIENVAKVVHLHNYYQFIFIRSGVGKHYINGEVTDLNKGDLFFISPSDQHSIKITSPSVISSIKFSEYSKGKLRSLQKAWKGEFPGLKKGRSPLNIKVKFSERDEQIVNGIFDLFNSLKHEILINEAIIHLQLITLVAIIERNLSYNADSITPLKGVSGPNKSLEILLTYIHRHILRTELLTATHIAAHQGVSVHYIGTYFKKLTGLAMKDYINQCRQTIIERKLLSTELSVTQLAAEFNFTDESHFNKSFKKHWGMSPLKYREQHHKKE